MKGRPKKYRYIHNDPKISQFSPRGKPGRPNEINLTLDQYESLRLADFLGLRQVEAAKSMNISQQTFSRILRSARKILTEALVEGKIIKIQGGTYVITDLQKENRP